MTIWRIMHELPWITIFGSRVRRFSNDFHEWRGYDWKSLAKRITSVPKIVIHGNDCIFLFLTRHFMFWTYNSAEYIHYRSLISPLSLRTVFSDSIVTSPLLICDFTRTWGTGIVTSYSSIVRARANWRKCDLHLWLPTVNIDFSPPGIHGLACKKTLIIPGYPVIVCCHGGTWASWIVPNVLDMVAIQRVYSLLTFCAESCQCGENFNGYSRKTYIYSCHLLLYLFSTDSYYQFLLSVIVYFSVVHSSTKTYECE